MSIIKGVKILNASVVINTSGLPLKTISAEEIRIIKGTKNVCIGVDEVSVIENREAKEVLYLFSLKKNVAKHENEFAINWWDLVKEEFLKCTIDLKGYPSSEVVSAELHYSVDGKTRSLKMDVA